MAHCTQLCTTKKNFYSQQIKKIFLGITLFDTFSLLFQKEKNLMPLFLIACNRGLTFIHACHNQGSKVVFKALKVTHDKLLELGQVTITVKKGCAVVSPSVVTRNRNNIVTM